jgi:hypothetical protein
MSLAQAIKQTLDYSRQFHGHLTLKDLDRRLISPQIYTSANIHRQVKLLQLRLPVSPPAEFGRLLAQARSYVHRYFRRFSTILFIGLTGSVAAGSPSAFDDIDFLIITQSHTLWLTRFLLYLYFCFHRLPIRRFGRRQISRQLCLNLWLDDFDLSLPPAKRNLQNACDLMMMIPLLNRRSTYQRFLAANPWAKKFLASGYHRLTSNKTIRTAHPPAHVSVKVVNYLFFLLQYHYLKPKITTELVNLHQSFFHPSRS